MLFINRGKQAQRARNRAKAQTLVDQYGDRAPDHVRQQIAQTAWEIQKQAHWRRIATHVNKLLRH